MAILSIFKILNNDISSTKIYPNSGTVAEHNIRPIYRFWLNMLKIKQQAPMKLLMLTNPIAPNPALITFWLSQKWNLKPLVKNHLISVS